MNICIVEKDIAEIKLIKPLWEQLNSIHCDKSVYFKSKYENFTFEKSLESIYRKAQDGINLISLICQWNGSITGGNIMFYIFHNLVAFVDIRSIINST